MEFTKTQIIYLGSISFLAVISMFLDKYLNYVFVGIIVNVAVWSWFITLIWNYAKERQSLRKENKKLRERLQKLKGAEK